MNEYIIHMNHDIVGMLTYYNMQNIHIINNNMERSCFILNIFNIFFYEFSLWFCCLTIDSPSVSISRPRWRRSPIIIAPFSHSRCAQKLALSSLFIDEKKKE